MAVAGKDRFVRTGLKILIDKSNIFPPPIFNYEGKSFTTLGFSNKEDLMPVNFDTAELQRAITYGTMKQVVCTTDNGDLYDACIYKNETGNTFLYAIRTRNLPDEKGKKGKQ